MLREIQEIIDADTDAGRIIARSWLAHTVLSRHPLTVTRDREFNTLCRQAAVNAAVLEVLRRLKLDDADPDRVAGPGTLPGFKHLFRKYSFERDGELHVVPIEKTTAAERNSRAAQYDRMSEGCAEHADELRRYRPPATTGTAA